MLACPNCGANLRFDPESQRLKCDFCGGDFDPEELKVLLDEMCAEAGRRS